MNRKNSQPALVESIFTGQPKTVGDRNAEQPMEREWTTSIFKEPVAGPVFAGRTNLSGDAQADLKHHGGPEKAIFVYPAEHYAHWRKELGHPDIGPGGMGENFSVLHLTEEDVAIGDIFTIGEAVIQVSQPRQPCWKPARRHRVKELALMLQNSGRTGWYYRVLQEGWVKAGQPLELIERTAPEWSVARCNHIMHTDRENFAAAESLANVKELAVNWKNTLRKRAELREVEDIGRRVYGPNVE